MLCYFVLISKHLALTSLVETREASLNQSLLLAMEEQVHQHGFAEKEASPPSENLPEEGAEMQSNQTTPRSAFMSPSRWAVLCSSMLLAMVQAALDSTITADLQPTIIDSLGEISKLPWINVTYSLGLGGPCLLW